MTPYRRELIVRISLLLGLDLDKKAVKDDDKARELEAEMLEALGKVLKTDWTDQGGADNRILSKMEKLEF